MAVAVAALRAGELVAFPTETVYGLGADASNAAAIRRIYSVKGRPSSHPLIVHLSSTADIAAWAGAVPRSARVLAERFWPGPLTLVLPRAAHVLTELTGGQDSVALRIPEHPVAQQLLHEFGGGIAAPSANRYGRVSPTRAQHVRDEFGDEVAIVLEGGACRVGLESTIVSCLGDRTLLLRPGGISQLALEAVIGPVRRAAQGEGPRTPGSTQAHYAPSTPLTLVSQALLARDAQAPDVAVLAMGPQSAEFRGVLWLDGTSSAEAFGHDLYANLRTLDRAGARRILVEAPPFTQAWDAVRDRLTRAACGSAESA